MVFFGIPLVAGIGVGIGTWMGASMLTGFILLFIAYGCYSTGEYKYYDSFCYTKQQKPEELTKEQQANLNIAPAPQTSQ